MLIFSLVFFIVLFCHFLSVGTGSKSCRRDEIFIDPKTGTRTIRYRLKDTEHRRKKNKEANKMTSTTRSKSAHAAKSKKRVSNSPQNAESDRARRKAALDKAQSKKAAELEAKEQELKKREREIAEKEAKAVILPDEPKRTRKKPKTDDYVDPFKDEIDLVMKEDIWKIVKFLPEDEAGQHMVYSLVVDGMMERYPDVNNRIRNKNDHLAFIHNHGPTMANSLNGIRNQCIGKLGKACTDYMYKHEGTLPTMDLLRKCALRDIDLDDNEEVATYEWYWTVALPTMCGTAKHWNREEHFFHTISQAKLSDSKGSQEIVPASTEAFLVTCMDNYRESWIEQNELKKKHPDRKICHGKKKAPGTANKLVDKEDTGTKMVMVYDPKYFGKYTDNTGGSNILGGWSDEGKAYYVDLEVQVEESRNDKKCLAMEKQFLEHLRATKKIRGYTWKQHEAIKRKAARGVSVAEPLPPSEKPQVLSAAFLKFVNAKNNAIIPLPNNLPESTKQAEPPTDETEASEQDDEADGGISDGEEHEFAEAQESHAD